MGSGGLILVNGTVVNPTRVMDRASVVVEGSRVSHIIPGGTEVPDEFISSRGLQVIDATGCYVCPGFIDMHVHGGGGADLMDGTVEAVLTMAEAHAKGGSTAIVPTTTCAAMEDILLAIESVHAAKAKAKGARVLGVHLEGPYIAPAQKGAQDSRHIKVPTDEEVARLLERSEDVLAMSAAPDVPGVLELGRELRRRGVVASIGHTDATYDEVVLAVEAGFTHVTHLYSSMSAVHRRNLYRVAGVVEAAYVLRDLSVDVIADGKHLPPALLRLAYQVKGPDKVALITDAMRGAGMPEGNYVLGGRKDGLPVVVEDQVAKLLDRSSFAGSVALTSRLVRNMVELAGVPIEDAVRMASSTPAELLGFGGSKGRLDRGMDADIVVLDRDWTVRMTVVEGTIVYQRQAADGVCGRDAGRRAIP